MAGKVTSTTKTKATSSTTVTKKKASKPRGLRTDKKTSKATTPKPRDDKASTSSQEKEERGGFGGFLDSFQGAFDSAGAGLGKLHASTKPLEFSSDEKANGLEAADTMDKLAGPDGKWDRNDLANNFAQLPKTRGFDLKQSVARGALFKQHNVPPEERGAILDQSRQIKEANPEIDQLRNFQKKYGGKYEGMSDENKAKYDQTVAKYSKSLAEKGLSPLEVSDLQQMGRASKVLQGKLSEAGLPQPAPGTPVDAGQYRGLFEGKSPLRTQAGF